MTINRQHENGWKNSIANDCGVTLTENKNCKNNQLAKLIFKVKIIHRIL